MLILQHFTKQCAKCMIIKNILHFHNSKSSKDGKNCYCKECASKASKEWVINNRDKKKELDRIYRENNKEKLSQYFKDRYYEKIDEIKIVRQNYYICNIDKFKQKSKDYYRKDIIKQRAIRKKYRENHSDKLKEYFKIYGKTDKRKMNDKNQKGRRRSITKKGDVNINELSILHTMAKTCYWCGISLKNKKVHIDHYMPLVKGGEHTMNNLVVSCHKCNLSKNAKDPIAFANSIGKLL